MDYLVIIEPASDGTFSAYVPDLPGCVSCGGSREEVQQLIREAIELHIEALKLHGDPVPQPVSQAITVHAEAA